jgi:radical SAM protein with 4Fe4S-binding SPASM domain
MQGELLGRVSARAEALHVPLEVLFEVTHRCNLPCQHCYLPDHQDHGELTLAEIAVLFDQLVAAGTIFLTLTGGEILSRRDFREIIQLAYDRGFAIKLLSNATMITAELAQFFAERNVVQVSVSVYGGRAEIHDAVTGIPGSFARTLAGIEQLREHGLQVVVKTPVMTLNGAAAREVHDLALRHHMPCSFDFSLSGKNDGDDSPLAYQLRKREMVDILQQSPFREIFDGPLEGPGPDPCSAGKAYCAVGPTGDVMPCILMPMTVLGNVRHRSFTDIWRSAPGWQPLREITSDDLHTCHSCDVKAACTRCPGLAMHRGQGLDGCDLTGKEVASAKIAAVRLRVVK